MRRDTLTVRARYVVPVEGAADRGWLPDDAGSADRLAGPGRRAGGRPRPGQRGDRPRVRQRPHAPRAGAAARTTTGRRTVRGRRTSCRWLRRVIAQRRGASDATLRVTAAENLRAAIEAGTTLLADSTTAGLSWGPIAGAPVRAVVFAEVIGLRRDRGLQTDAAAWEWLGSVRPEAQVAACARVGPEPARALQHVGMALPQGRGQPAAADDPPGRDARGAPLARAPRRPHAAVPRGHRRLGRRVGADRAPAGRLRPPRRAPQRRLADRPRDLPRSRRLLAAPTRGRARRQARRHRLLPADPRPIRPCPAPVPRAARARGDRLPGHGQPGVEPSARPARRDAIPPPPR